nr:MAG TPA: hypothetical protein [Caudoviricetes sp.]
MRKGFMSLPLFNNSKFHLYSIKLKEGLRL